MKITDIIDIIEDADINALQAKQELHELYKNRDTTTDEDIHHKQTSVKKLYAHKHDVIAQAIKQDNEWMTDPETVLCVNQALKDEIFRRVKHTKIIEAFQNKLYHPQMRLLDTKNFKHVPLLKKEVTSYPYIYITFDIQDCSDDTLQELANIVEPFYDILQDEYVLAYALDHAKFEVIHDEGIATVAVLTEGKYMVCYNDDLEGSEHYEVNMKPSRLIDVLYFIQDELPDWKY